MRSTVIQKKTLSQLREKVLQVKKKIKRGERRFKYLQTVKVNCLMRRTRNRIVK